MRLRLEDDILYLDSRRIARLEVENLSIAQRLAVEETLAFAADVEDRSAELEDLLKLLEERTDMSTSHDPETGALILLTPAPDAPATFKLYREGRDEIQLDLTMKEARNLAEELERFTKTSAPYTRVLIPDIDKPKKVRLTR